jgi:predicted phage tail protein
MNYPGPQESMYNVSRVRVGADLGGVLAVVGTIVVLVAGIPPVKWFLAAALASGAVFAVGLSIWHRRHPGPLTPPNTIR